MMGTKPMLWRAVLGLAVSAAWAGGRVCAADAPVTVTDNGTTWTMDNGIVKATINKRDARMPSLVYKGINTMGGGGYWEQSPSGTLTQTLTIDPSTNGGERGEVAVKDTDRTSVV